MSIPRILHQPDQLRQTTRMRDMVVLRQLLQPHLRNQLVYKNHPPHGADKPAEQRPTKDAIQKPQPHDPRAERNRARGGRDDAGELPVRGVVAFGAGAVVDVGEADCRAEQEGAGGFGADGHGRAGPEDRVNLK